MKTLIVIDDDPGVLDSTTMLLELDGYTVFSFTSGEDFLACGVPIGTICIIMDICLGGEMDGISVITELQHRGETTPVVIVTGSGDIPTVARAMKAGATNVLEKPCRVDQLSAALRDVQEPILFQARASDLLARLTSRERDLINCVLAGKQNAEIALAQETSRAAIEVERIRIMEKLEASSFSEVVRLVLMRPPRQ